MLDINDTWGPEQLEDDYPGIVGATRELNVSLDYDELDGFAPWLVLIDEGTVLMQELEGACRKFIWDTCTRRWSAA